MATAFGMMSGAASTAVDGLRRTASWSSMSSFLSDSSTSGERAPKQQGCMDPGPHVDTSGRDRDLSFGSKRDLSSSSKRSSSFDMAGVSPCESEAGPECFLLSGRSPQQRRITPAHDPERRSVSGASLSLGSAPVTSLGSDTIEEEESDVDESSLPLASEVQHRPPSADWLLAALVCLVAAVAATQLLRSEAGRALATGAFIAATHASSEAWAPLHSTLVSVAQHSLLRPVSWLDGDVRTTMARLQHAAGHVAQLEQGVVFFSAEKLGATLVPRASGAALIELFPHLHDANTWSTGLTGHASCSVAQNDKTSAKQLLPPLLLQLLSDPTTVMPASAWHSPQDFAAELLGRLEATQGGTASAAAVQAVAAYAERVPLLCAGLQPLSYQDEVRLSTLQADAAAALRHAMPAADSPAVRRAALQGALLPLALLLRSMQRSAALRGPLDVTAEVLSEVQRLFPPLPWLVGTAPRELQLRQTRGRVFRVPAGTRILLYAETSNRDPVEFGGAFSSAVQAAAPAWAVPPPQRTERQGGGLGCAVPCNASTRSLPFDAAAAQLQAAAEDSLADRVLEADDLSWQAWGWLCAGAAAWLWTAAWAAPAAAALGALAHSSVLLYLLCNVLSAVAWCFGAREASLLWAAAQLGGTACLAQALAAAFDSLRSVDQSFITPTRKRSNTENPAAIPLLSLGEEAPFARHVQANNSALRLRNRGRRSTSESSVRSRSMSGWTDADSECSAVETITTPALDAVLLSQAHNPQPPARRLSLSERHDASTRTTPAFEAVTSPPLDSVSANGDVAVAAATPQLAQLGAAALAMQLTLAVVIPGVDMHPTTAAGQVCMLALVIARSLHVVRAQIADALSLTAVTTAHPWAASAALGASAALFLALPLVLLQGHAYYVLSNVLGCCLWLPAVAAAARASAAHKLSTGAEAAKDTPPAQAATGICSTLGAVLVSPWLPLAAAACGLAAAGAVAGGGLLYLQTAALCNWSQGADTPLRMGSSMPSPAFVCANCPVAPPQPGPPLLLPGVCDGHLSGLLHRLDAHTTLMYHMLALQNDMPRAPATGKAVGVPQWHRPLRRANTAVGVPVIAEDEDDAVSPIPNFVNNAALQVLRARELFGEAHVADDATQFESPEQARAFLNAASRGGARLPPPLVSHSDLLSDAGLAKIAFNGLGAHMVRAATAADVTQLLSVPGAHPARLQSRIVYISDVHEMGSFETRGGFSRLGACAVFDGNGTAVGIVVNDIPHARRVEEGAWVLPGDAAWPRAKFVWRSSLVVAVTVMDHLVGAHMVANTVNAAVREKLPTAHPVRRLLRPGDFMSVWINQGAIPTLLSQNDVLHRTLPFTRAGQLRSIRHALQSAQWTGVQQDLLRRGMHNAPAWLYPYGSDLKQFEAVVRRFVRKYLAVFFPSGRVEGDAALMAWMEHIQGGYPSVAMPAGRDLHSCVEVLTAIIVHESQHHMQVGRVTSYVTDPALASSKLTSSNMGDVQSAMQMFLVASVTNNARPMLMANYDHLVPKRDAAAYYAAVEVWGRFRHELCQLAHAIDVANAQAEEDATVAAAAGDGAPPAVEAASRRWPTNGANPRLMSVGVSI